jgi:hypothetical protein
LDERKLENRIQNTEARSQNMDGINRIDRVPSAIERKDPGFWLLASEFWLPAEF